MFYILIAIHVTLCLMLIGLVLVQQGKGADAGATFGGSGNTLLGAGGAADFITKGTTSIAIAFMVTSILLVRAYTSGSVPTVKGTPADPLAGSVMQGVEAPVAKDSTEPAAAVKMDAVTVDPAVSSEESTQEKSASPAAEGAPEQAAAPETESPEKK